jgi:nucleoside-diphosphate-sugar epimerase
MPAAPIDVYGAAKRAVEIVGETLQRNGSIEFISLRIATVIGPGARNTSSPWRSEIFEKLSTADKIALPYAQDDPLTVVKVDDIARMLVKLASAESVQHSLYNTPAELFTAGDVKRIVESIAPEVRIELVGRSRPLAPLADGSRFADEFSFESTPLAVSLRNALLHSSNRI